MLLLHLVSAKSWGGGERYALDICTHFRSLGWKTGALTRNLQAVDVPFARAGIKTVFLPLHGYADPFSPLQLASMLRREKEKGIILHAHKYKDAFTALVAKKLSRRSDVKVVMTRHLVRTPHRSRLMRWICRRLDAHLFDSRLARDTFLKPWPKPLPFPGDRVHALHCSVAEAQPPYAPPPEKGPRIILYIGRLHPEKGVETLIKALPALRGRRARCYICGTGEADYVDSLHRLGDRLGVSDLIDWKGHVPATAPMIEGAHIAVLPSAVPEAFGLVNIEVMAGGRMQICTALGAQREYLDQGVDALFIEPGDSETLSVMLSELLDDESVPPRYVTMGRAAWEAYARNLAWPRFAARLERIYRSLA